MTREFFNCDCHTEGLIVDKLEDETCIALWSYGQRGDKISFSNRLRWCWNILLNGLPWADCVILHETEVQRLIKTLQKHMKKKKK